MLAGWLNDLPRSSVRYVYHLHDRTPPAPLRALPEPPRADAKSDFRARRFPGGGHFKMDTRAVPPDEVDEYRLLYIYKDPVEAMVSRYGFGHCKHIGGNCGPSDAKFPKLDRYSRERQDLMGLTDFFDNWMNPSSDRPFPVIGLNYHKLWDNLDAVMAALGFPPEWAAKFPQRTETVRNDLTGAAEKNDAHTEATREGLRAMYEKTIRKQRDMPAVVIV